MTKRGFSIVEVIVAVAILMIGILSIVFLFPTTLRSARLTEMQTRATFLAQMKAEEIRRDDDTSSTPVRAIENLATPTAPITFPQDTELAYQFSGRTLLYEGETPDGDPGVARVIIRYAPEFRQSADPTKDVLYELRFGP